MSENKGINVVMDGFITYIYSRVGYNEVCIIQYQNDRQGKHPAVIKINCNYLNDCNKRTRHYTEALHLLFEYNSDIYNYVVRLYKQIKAKEHDIVQRKTLALGRYYYNNSIIRYTHKKGLQIHKSMNENIYICDNSLQGIHGANVSMMAQ